MLLVQNRGCIVTRGHFFFFQAIVYVRLYVLNHPTLLFGGIIYCLGTIYPCFPSTAMSMQPVEVQPLQRLYLLLYFCKAAIVLGLWPFILLMVNSSGIYHSSTNRYFGLNTFPGKVTTNVLCMVSKILMLSSRYLYQEQ